LTKHPVGKEMKKDSEKYERTITSEIWNKVQSSQSLWRRKRNEISHFPNYLLYGIQLLAKFPCINIMTDTGAIFIISNINEVFHFSHSDNVSLYQI
jgi:hypothetical protein